MSVEWFLKLKEIDSLTKMRLSDLKAKSEQVDRLSKLLERQNETNSQSAKLKQNLIELREEMAQIESKIKIASEQKQRLLDLGGDEKKIQDYQQQITQLEDQGFVLLSREEEIEREISDAKIFLLGLEKTFQEIQGEVNTDIEKIETNLKNIELRLDLLINELPDDFRKTLEKTMAKNLAHGPFTRIDQGSCYFCRFKISRIDESEIDMQKSLKTCPQCTRIFLPYGA